MADTKFSALSAASALDGTEEWGANQSSSSKKITPAQVLTYVQKKGAGNTNADAPNSTIAINVLTGAPATIATKTLTIAAGDTVTIRVKGSIINNSGGTKTYSARCSLGTLTADLVWGTTVAASATNRVPVEIEATFGVKNTSSAWMHAKFTGTTAAALGTSGAEILLLDQRVVQQSSSDQTGSKATTVAMFSSANNATQSFELISWNIEQIPTNP